MLDHGEPAASGNSPAGFTYELPFNNYQPQTVNAYPYSTVGKLFFVIPPGATEAPGNYVCSGSVTGNGYTVYDIGFMHNGNYSKRQWDVFGYPQESPFSGNNMYQDEGATGVLNPFGTSNIVKIGNPQTGGKRSEFLPMDQPKPTVGY